MSLSLLNTPNNINERKLINAAAPIPQVIEEELEQKEHGAQRQDTLISIDEYNNTDQNNKWNDNFSQYATVKQLTKQEKLVKSK